MILLILEGESESVCIELTSGVDAMFIFLLRWDVLTSVDTLRNHLRDRGQVHYHFSPQNKPGKCMKEKNLISAMEDMENTVKQYISRS